MGLLRLLLSFAVVIAHTHSIPGVAVIGGSKAVMFFFVMSGFYMHLVLDQQYRDHWRVFYFNRFLRLFPAYWATLLIIALLAAFRSQLIDAGYSYNVVARNLARPDLGLSAAIPNLFIFGADFLRQFAVNHDGNFAAWRYADPENAFREGLYLYLWVPQIWSVSNELLFYLAAPLIARLRLVGFLSVVACGWFLHSYASVADLALRHVLPNYNFIYFMLGMASYRVLPFLARCPKSCLCALAGVPFAYFAFDGLSTHAPWTWMPLAMCIPPLFLVTKNWSVDRFVGNLSYPVYLTHFIFAWFIPGSKFHAIYIMGIAVVAGLAINLLVERPIEVWRSRLKKKSASLAPVA